jgi:hypothetical protein
MYFREDGLKGLEKRNGPYLRAIIHTHTAR